MSTIYGTAITFGGAGGVKLQLNVTAPAGSTVTAKKGNTIVNATESNGVWVAELPEAGTWIVTATKGAQTVSQTVVFEDMKNVTLEWFLASISVTYPAGSTCTCTSGATTLTAPNTTGSYTFNISSAGTWTVSCFDGIDTASQSVVVTTNGQSETISLSYPYPIVSTTATIGVTYTTNIFSLSAA